MMDYKFDGSLDECKPLINKWTRDKLLEMQGEAPEDLFIDYIVVMIGNKKSMQELTDELKDFFGEEEAR